MQVHHILVPLMFAAACTDTPEQLGEGSHGVLVNNRISSNRISANRISANRISANRISANRISANRLEANVAAMGELLETPEGLELLAFFISCALPEGIALVAPDPNGGPELEFYGEIGLAPKWTNRPLTRIDRRWVSACMLSRVNNNNVTVEISMRGPSQALATTESERASHTIEEGAFYGDLFRPLDEPLRWNACRGKDQAAGESGGLTDRDCAEPDPANPGKSMCGFTFAGDCADFAPPANGYACKRLSDDGFYMKCTATSVNGKTKSADDDEDDQTSGDHAHDDDEALVGGWRYHQVITTYLTP